MKPQTWSPHIFKWFSSKAIPQLSLRRRRPYNSNDNLCVEKFAWWGCADDASLSSQSVRTILLHSFTSIIGCIGRRVAYVTARSRGAISFTSQEPFIAHNGERQIRHFAASFRNTVVDPSSQPIKHQLYHVVQSRLLRSVLLYGYHFHCEFRGLWSRLMILPGRSDTCIWGKLHRRSSLSSVLLEETRDLVMGRTAIIGVIIKGWKDVCISLNVKYLLMTEVASVNFRFWLLAYSISPLLFACFFFMF